MRNCRASILPKRPLETDFVNRGKNLICRVESSPTRWRVSGGYRDRDDRGVRSLARDIRALIDGARSGIRGGGRER